MSLDDVREPLERWSAEGARAAVATLVRVRRSAPRPPGARFAVNERGDVAGSVSSGCVEGDLFEHLRGVLDGAPASLLRYGITDEMAAEVGLSCGGEIEVLVAEHDPGSPAWGALLSAVTAGAPAVLITALSHPLRGRQLLLLEDGSAVGSLDSSRAEAWAASAASDWLSVEDARVVELPESNVPPDGGEPSEAEESSEAAESRQELLVETFLPPPRLAIVGASPVAEALCGLAVFLGFEVTVIDPRETFASPDRFPEALRVIHSWPDEGLEAMGLDRHLYLVVLAHDRKLDVPALASALRAGCRYIGQIGGRRTQRLRREALGELGFDEEALAAIRGPVGLEIGARTPREIALAILAEMTAVRRGK